MKQAQNKTSPNVKNNKKKLPPNHPTPTHPRLNSGSFEESTFLLVHGSLAAFCPVDIGQTLGWIESSWIWQTLETDFYCFFEILIEIQPIYFVLLKDFYLQSGHPQLTQLTGVPLVSPPRQPRQTGAPSGAATKAESSTTTSPTESDLVAKRTLPTMSIYPSL